jgi:hypothetical protein
MCSFLSLDVVDVNEEELPATNSVSNIVTALEYKSSLYEYGRYMGWVDKVVEAIVSKRQLYDFKLHRLYSNTFAAFLPFSLS